MLQMVERGFFNSEILRGRRLKLSAIPGMPDAHSPSVQVLRIGKFNHPKYGEFEITTKILAELKQNFDAKIRGVDVAIDYFHKSDEEAAGWIKELYLDESDTELWARVDWTTEATRKLSEREVRYFSPDFAFKWQDPESGTIYNNVLFGGGLTNRPFVKDMAAIVASENKGEIMNEKELAELKAQVLKLAEDGKQKDAAMEMLKTGHAALKKQLEDAQVNMPSAKPKSGDVVNPTPAPAPQDGGDDVEDLKKQLAEANAKLAEYAEKSKKDQEAKQMAEKETAFVVLLSEGKACVAQKDSYMKGDMNEFIKLAQPLNLDGKGHTNAGPEGEKEDRILKLAEEKCKADPKLSRLDAIKIAQREVR